MKVILLRLDYEAEQTLGHLIVMDGLKRVFECKTLELPWRDNKSRISCVPPGCYPLVYEWSPRFQMNLWELKEVPDRYEAKFHSGNFAAGVNRQIEGCILLGDFHLDIDGDGFRDIRNSRKTLEKFNEVLSGYCELLIIEA